MTVMLDDIRSYTYPFWFRVLYGLGFERKKYFKVPTLITVHEERVSLHRLGHHTDFDLADVLSVDTGTWSPFLGYAGGAAKVRVRINGREDFFYIAP